MLWQFARLLIFGCLFSLSLSKLLHAEENSTEWNSWFTAQIEQHPEVIAARETMNAAISMADILERPLYNPELETEYEREEKSNNFRVGFSQTIDLWDKRGVRKQQAVVNRAVAKQVFQLAFQHKLSEGLRAIVVWQSASDQAELAREQEAQLDTLLELIKVRQHSGDLGQLDAELIFLGLSRLLNESAEAEAELKAAEAELLALLPDWSTRASAVPSAFWFAGQFKVEDRWIEGHPVVEMARSEWEVLRQSAELARRNAKAEPTFGLSAGRSTEGDVAALTLSMPLNLRNNFSAATRAASQEALSAEAHYRAVRREQLAAIMTAQSTLLAYQRQYQKMQSLMEGRGAHANSLLSQQWAEGDLGTTDYLLALQQWTEGVIAGIDLTTAYRLAHIEWLYQSGQLSTVLADSTH